MIELSKRLANLSPAQRKLLEQRLKDKPGVAEPIAIVGMSCRFGGAANLDEYWRLIRDKIDGTGEIPNWRWDVDALYDPTGEETGKMSVKWAGMINDIDRFDPMFFGISPREAARMDPQQRLLLEVSWEALEIGGLAPDRMAGTSTGVFVGIGGTDYSKIPCQFENYYHYIDAHVGTGNALSIAANRVSYILDLRGPSIAVDTACSSGMMGIHLAVNALRTHECDAALAGGVNAILTPETTIAFSKAQMLSRDGKCRPFDAGANGYVRGEGCAMIVLKRLTDATRDGDRVFAVIRGTATNQDGRTSGITAPNSVSQEKCIRAALRQAGLTTDQVSYIEAHGTGTPLGDPIEFESLRSLFRDKSQSKPPVHVTSVKANIGHTETVSGVAGVIKVVLMLQHEIIPGQTHLKELNPHISLDGTRLRVPTDSVSWKSDNGSRIAGISSFGFGGANTHVVIEEAAPTEIESPNIDRPQHLMTLSAKSPAGIERLATKYIEFLDANTDASLADLCHSANAGRAHFNHRVAISTQSREDLREKLAGALESKKPSGVKVGQVKLTAPPKVAFLFTGQGAQYIDMGRELYESQPSFRATIDQCNEILGEHLEHSLLSVLYPDRGETNCPPETINETAYTQPALFSIEYALAMLWRSWGVEPSVVIGHSVGEYVAATVSGVLNLEDGLSLIALRARLMQELPQDGLMAVIFDGADRVRPALTGYEDCVSIAAANGPDNTVISGNAEAVREIAVKFAGADVKTQLLTVSHAFHSPLMEPMLDEFESFAAKMEYNAPKIPIVSNLNGELITDDPPGATYWRNHIRNSVRFAEGMQRLADLDLHVMLECGPAPVLLGMGRRCLPKNEMKWLPSLRKGQSDWNVMLASLADLYLLGATVDWRGFDSDWPRQRIALPTYPFERNRHWFGEEETKRPISSGARGPMVHPLLGSRIPSALDATLFEGRTSSRSPAYLVDHQVQGSPVVPAAAYVEQGLAVAEQTFGSGSHAVESVAIQQAMFLPPGAGRLMQVTVSPEMGGECTYDTFSIPADTEDPNTRWSLHACGRLRHADTLTKDSPNAIDFEEIRTRVIDIKSREQFYEIMHERGLSYGPAFQVLRDLHRTDHDGIAEVQLSESVLNEIDQYHLHPALGDACFQSVAGVVPLEPDGSYSPFTYMPINVKRVRIHAPLCERMFTYAIRTSEDDRPSPESVDANVFLCDEHGQVLVELLGIRVLRVGRSELGQRELDVHDWLYGINWTEQSIAADAPIAGEGKWLIFADRAGAGRELAAKLHDIGQSCAVITPGEEFSTTSAENGDARLYRIDPLREEDYRQLFDDVLRDNATCAGIIHLWSLDIPPLDDGNGASLDAARRLGCGSVLQLIRALVRANLSKSPALYLGTQGAMQVGESAVSISVGQSSLWGMGRVATVEHPELTCRLIDFDTASPSQDIAVQIQSELSAPARDGQIAYRSGTRFVARLKRDKSSLPTDDEAQQGAIRVPADSAFRLRLGKAGSFDSLWFEGFSRQKPEAGQVELEVRATGLNFSDVLKAMGLYPGIKDDIVPLGIECSGIVTSIGTGVDRFKVGDHVMGVVPYSFASHARTAEYCLVPKPKDIDDCDAATIPITFLTAYYGLVRLADLQPGERLLMHAGAGGVGLAAIQIAKHIGAEIFATAGSEEKRDYLRSLGVQHVFNSRSLDFADEIMQVTNREGVDVVFNSLPGDAITKSLSILRAYGRFLEIGKTDIYKNSMIGLAPFQDNLSYFAIDLDRMLRQRPDYIRKMFAEMMEYFDKGIYRPLVLTQFPVEETIDAFRYMAARKNIGKVVVSLERDHSPANDVPSDDNARPALIRDDATYLITGGLGALGLRVARWLVDGGAMHVALMSRREPSGSAADTIDSLCAGGANVFAIQGDVAEVESLKNSIAQIPSKCPPLRGVVHAAGVLADGVLFDMSLEQLDKAMAPKVHGAWNLHTVTRDEPLDFFVLFSSVACVLGSPGQGNYAAANSFLDGLANYRRSHGLPATSINWGPWAESGMAAEAGRDNQIKSRGMDLIPPEHGLNLMQQLLENNVANVAVMDARWPELLRLMSGRVPSLLEEIAATESEPADEDDYAVDHEFRNKLLSADLDERQSLLRDYFSEELARIMGLSASELNQEQPLNELGMDSLLGMELKNNLERGLAFTMPMAAFLETPNIIKLAEHAAKAIAADAGDQSTKVAAAAESWTPLVPLRTEGENAPLFCLHPLGGDVACYYELARKLDADRPVYALRGRGSDGQLDPHLSIEEMIGDYLKAIREVQPHGPYHLASWSAGGIYSYEMARMIREQGDEIGLLAFFDTPLPSIYDDLDLDDELSFLFHLGMFTNRFAKAEIDVDAAITEKLSSLEGDDRWQVALAIAKEHKVVPPDASTDHIRRVVEAGRSHAKMIQNYTIEPIDQTIHLFRPQQPDILGEMTDRTLDHDLGWGAILEDRLALHESPGDHFTMLEGENASALAAGLTKCLENVGVKTLTSSD